MVVAVDRTSGVFSNTATVTGRGPMGTSVSDRSDDGIDPDPDGDGNPNEPGENDPTEIKMVSFSVQKTSIFDPVVHDSDANGTLSPGDSLVYTVVAANNGTGDALNVMIDDTPDASTTLVTGSTTTTRGAILSGNTAGDSGVSIDVGALPVGETVTVTFAVHINHPLPAGIIEIHNQAVLSATGFNSIVSDDPGTAPGSDPTVDIVNVMTIPTLSTWGMLLLTLLLAGAAMQVMRRRSQGLPDK
jgi:uncharacterized repeat protein (TIGR01451 family)